MSSKTEVFKNWSLQTKTKKNFAAESNDEIRLESTFMAVGIKLKKKPGKLNEAVSGLSLAIELDCTHN